MPYIKQEDRTGLIHHPFAQGVVKDPGKLNFVITILVKCFLGTKPRYIDFNAAIGVLECAKLELYRRMVAPYEDTKIKENGDVY